MASQIRWTRVWVNSGSWWWIGRPGVLQFLGSQRVGHNWATELNWIESIWLCRSQQIVKNSSRDGNTRPPYLPPEQSVCRSSQEAIVRTGYRTTNWFQIEKGVRQACILSPWSFNLYADYIMQNATQMKHWLESRLLEEISVTSDKQMTPPLWQKAKRNLRASWGKWKRRVKSWFKTQHSKKKIISGPFT